MNRKIMNKTREVEEVLPPFGDLTARNPWKFWFKQTAAIGSRLNRFCPRRQAFSTLSSLKDINSSLVLSPWFRHPTTTNSRSSVNPSPAQPFSDSDIQTEQAKHLYHCNETVKSAWFFMVLSEEHSVNFRWNVCLNAGEGLKREIRQKPSFETLQTVSLSNAYTDGAFTLTAIYSDNATKSFIYNDSCWFETTWVTVCNVINLRRDQLYANLLRWWLPMGTETLTFTWFV